MSATVVFVESNGNPQVDTIITALPLGSVDAANLSPASHPISAGQHSFEKWIRAKITAITADLSIVDNFKVYLSNVGAGFKAGEALMCNLTESEKKYSEASYPAGGPSASASAVATRAIPVLEPTQSNIGIDGSLATEVPHDATLPVYTDFICLQLQTTLATPAGDVEPKVLVIQWDER